jgi:hypothetical protein
MRRVAVGDENHIEVLLSLGPELNVVQVMRTSI